MIYSEQTVSLLRRALLAILVLGIAGTEIELLLLKHFDGYKQFAPLILLTVSLLVLAWYGLTKSATSLRALQCTMVACLVSGGVGVILHFIGNIEYAQDSNPSIAGSELYLEAVMGSTPTLAPGTMVQLALVGLAFTFRHPRLRGKGSENDPT